MDKIDELLARRLTRLNSDAQNMQSPQKNLFTETEKLLIEKIKFLLTKANQEKFIILLLGRTGVGKTSTINTLLGRNIAKVSKFRRGTKNIQRYEAIVKEIPSVAVANDDRAIGRSRHTPDGELWLGKLYTTVFQKISKEGMLPFLLATANRLQDSNSSSPLLPENQFRWPYL